MRNSFTAKRRLPTRSSTTRSLMLAVALIGTLDLVFSPEAVRQDRFEPLHRTASSFLDLPPEIAAARHRKSTLADSIVILTRHLLLLGRAILYLRFVTLPFLLRILISASLSSQSRSIGGLSAVRQSACSSVTFCPMRLLFWSRWYFTYRIANRFSASFRHFLCAIDGPDNLVRHCASVSKATRYRLAVLDTASIGRALARGLLSLSGISAVGWY